MSHQQNLKYMMQSFFTLMVRSLSIVTKKIIAMNLGEKIIVIGLIGLTILLFLTPIFTINSNTIDQSVQYIFLPFSWSFLKTFVVTQAVIFTLLLYALYVPFKNFVVERLGFHGNTYTIYMIGIFLSGSVFVGMGDLLSVIDTYTTVIKPTIMYYVVQIILIILFAVALYFGLSLKKNKHYRGHVVGYHGNRTEHVEKKDGESLFE